MFSLSFFLAHKRGEHGKIVRSKDARGQGFCIRIRIRNEFVLTDNSLFFSSSQDLQKSSIYNFFLFLFSLINFAGIYEKN